MHPQRTVRMPDLRLAFYLDDGLICGGAERVAVRLIEYWRTEGWTVTLITRTGVADDFYPMPEGVRRVALDRHTARRQALPDKPGVAVRYLRHVVPVRSFLRFVRDSYRLRNVLRRVDADVCISFLTPANVKLIVSTFDLRCRVVVSERSDTRSKKYPRMWTALRRLLYRRADLVTTNNPGALVDMARYVPQARLARLPNPIELPPAAALANPDASTRIVTVGRLVPEKQHLMLIEAFAAMSDAFAAWELDLVGEGPMRPALENAIAEHGLQGRVHLHGQHGDVGTYYRRAGFFALPSRFEGMPNALLEAMAHGLPCVISSDLTGAREHVDDGTTGLLFSATDRSHLTRCLEALAGSAALRRTMGDNARARLADTSATVAYKAWDDALHSVVRPERSRGHAA